MPVEVGDVDVARRDESGTAVRSGMWRIGPGGVRAAEGDHFGPVGIMSGNPTAPGTVRVEHALTGPFDVVQSHGRLYVVIETLGHEHQVAAVMPAGPGRAIGGKVVGAVNDDGAVERPLGAEIFAGQQISTELAIGDVVGIIDGVAEAGQPNLAKLGVALGVLGGITCVAQSRQKNRDQQGNDGYHHQQFDKCKATFELHGSGCVMAHIRAPL